MASTREQHGRISARDALRALEAAVARDDLERASAMVWRLLSAGVADLGALERLAEGLATPEHLRFAMIAAVLAPNRPRAYAVMRSKASVSSPGVGSAPTDWAFICAPDTVALARRAGAAAIESGKPAVALARLARSLETSPHSAVTWTNVGVLREQLEDVSGGFRDLARAACLSPALAATWFALGNESAKRFDQAVAVRRFRRAIAVDPAHVAAQVNLAKASRRHGALDTAVDALRRALVLEPAQAPVMADLGQFALSERRMPEVRRIFARARAVGPNHAETRFFASLADLRSGDFEAGWRDYGWHEKLGFPKIRNTQVLPAWGEQQPDPTGLLVWNDQVGIGEEVMYLGVLQGLAAQVPLRAIGCSAKLKPLLARSFPGLLVDPDVQGASHSVDLGERPAQISLISAVARLRRSFADFPSHTGYLKADPDRTAALRRRYARGSSQPLIGISWSSPRGFQGPDKSVSLDHWAPVFRALDARFVSLQYEAEVAEIDDVRRRLGVEILVDPDLDTFGDLDGHAAQIAAMDRVISISNVAAHLAGAMGKPVDMLYPTEIALLWYWFHDRSGSPWYPSMTIHRPGPGEDRARLMRRLAWRLSSAI